MCALKAVQPGPGSGHAAEAEKARGSKWTKGTTGKNRHERVQGDELGELRMTKTTCIYIYTVICGIYDIYIYNVYDI